MPSRGHRRGESSMFVTPLTSDGHGMERPTRNNPAASLIHQMLHQPYGDEDQPPGTPQFRDPFLGDRASTFYNTAEPAFEPPRLSRNATAPVQHSTYDPWDRQYAPPTSSRTRDPEYGSPGSPTNRRPRVSQAYHGQGGLHHASESARSNVPRQYKRATEASVPVYSSVRDYTQQRPEPRSQSSTWSPHHPPRAKTSHYSNPRPMSSTLR